MSEITEYISFGLMAIKGIGEDTAAAVVEERKHGGEYTSLHDLCIRVDHKRVSRKALELMIKCGAMDGLPGTRRQKLAVLTAEYQLAKKIKKVQEVGQVNLFDLLNDITPQPVRDEYPKVALVIDRLVEKGVIPHARAMELLADPDLLEDAPELDGPIWDAAQAFLNSIQE